LIIKILQEIATQEGSTFTKIKKLMEFKKFRDNLERGIKNGEIFHKLENQNQGIVNLLNLFEESDFELYRKLFNHDVKNYLKKLRLKKSLDFENRNNSTQIGINTIFVEKPVLGLWTTGKSSFYLPTKPNQETKISLNLQSVVPVKVKFGFEEHEIHEEEIPKISEKKIELIIPAEIVKEDISEITINTDKLWLPNVILGISKSIKIGIKINQISISS
jgi:hypothetical protein